MKIRLAIATNIVDGKVQYCAHGADSLTDEQMADNVSFDGGPVVEFVDVEVPVEPTEYLPAAE